MFYLIFMCPFFTLRSRSRSPRRHRSRSRERRRSPSPRKRSASPRKPSGKEPSPRVSVTFDNIMMHTYLFIFAHIKWCWYFSMNDLQCMSLQPFQESSSDEEYELLGENVESTISPEVVIIVTKPQSVVCKVVQVYTLKTVIWNISIVDWC